MKLEIPGMLHNDDPPQTRSDTIFEMAIGIPDVAKVRKST